MAFPVTIRLTQRRLGGVGVPQMGVERGASRTLLAFFMRKYFVACGGRAATERA